jgi:hypothetical protein
MARGSPSAVQVIPLKNNLKIMAKEEFVKLISDFPRTGAES